MSVGRAARAMVTITPTPTVVVIATITIITIMTIAMDMDIVTVIVIMIIIMSTTHLRMSTRVTLVELTVLKSSVSTASHLPRSSSPL